MPSPLQLMSSISGAFQSGITAWFPLSSVLCKTTKPSFWSLGMYHKTSSRNPGVFLLRCDQWLWISFSALVRNYRLDWFGWQRRSIFSCCTITCTTASPSACISKSPRSGLTCMRSPWHFNIYTIFWWFCLSNADGAFIMWRKCYVSANSAWVELIAQENMVLGAIMQEWHAHNILYCVCAYWELA